MKTGSQKPIIDLIYISFKHSYNWEHLFSPSAQIYYLINNYSITWSQT